MPLFNVAHFRYHHEPFWEESAVKRSQSPADNGISDYQKAVAKYRKTFPSKQDVLEQTPDPAVREMLLHLQEMGCETTFDRFDQQQPQCSFGMAGVCCRNCCMGPCKITRKSPKGVCGADADVIVARNLLRAMAAGIAAHGARGRESMLALKYAAEGTLDLPIEGEGKVRKTAEIFGLETEGKSIAELAGKIAEILLEDLSRTIPAEHRTLKAFAAPERLERWKELDLLPISAYHESFESLHQTSTGTNGDWKSILHQFERCGLAFSWSSVLGSSIAMDSLFGLPARSTCRVNLGALEKGYVNIAVHGHSPLLVQEIVKQGQQETWVQKAKEEGALGIRFYGICCSGLSAMYRYGNVIPLSNAVGAELVLGTGALDLWVADVQDVFPSIIEVANCFQTTVVTTSDSARLPGAEHYGFTHDHSNLGEIKQLAQTILQRAIESFAARRNIPVFIPRYEVKAEVGFSVEYLTALFGGTLKPLQQALEDGKILGIVNLVGCNNPRVLYEKAILEVASLLNKHNILILTNGCASFPLLKLGFCNTDAASQAGDSLRGFLEEYHLPPVLHMGECLDNARASALFKGLADATGQPIPAMPYAFSSPEWSNEKGIAAALSFRLLGMNSYHCVYPPTQGSANVTQYLMQDTEKRFGGKMVVDCNPLALAEKLVEDIKQKRRQLSWG